MPTTIPIGFQDLCIAASWKSIIHVNIKSHTNDSTFVVTWACFTPKQKYSMKPVYHDAKLLSSFIHSAKISSVHIKLKRDKWINETATKPANVLYYPSFHFKHVFSV